MKEEKGLQQRSEDDLKALQSKLKQLQRKHVSMSETLGDLEANRVLKQLNDTSYRTMTLRVNAELQEIEDQLEKIRLELVGATNGKKWISWLKEFGQEIESLDSMSKEQKKVYIEGLVKRIDVTWNEEKREHNLNLILNLPIVNDGITWRAKDQYERDGRRVKRHDVFEGDNKTTIIVQKKDSRG